MSGSKRKHRTNRIVTDYVLKVLSFVAIALVLTIIMLLILNKPVKSMIHNIESAQDIQVRDIVVNDNIPEDDQTFAYGDKMGVITCENIGLNANIYFGSNRKSMKSGVGFSNKTAMFGEGKVSMIAGYDETYLSSLTHIKNGDIIDISTPSGNHQYTVLDSKYISTETKAYNSDDEDMLVICSICSDLSKHSGEYFYVFAQRTDGGVE